MTDDTDTVRRLTEPSPPWKRLRMSRVAEYLRHALRWQRGRQGSGYDKMLLLTADWPVPCDGYLIRYPEGAHIPPHTDPVGDGRHYRLNIVLRAPREGGEFRCADPIFETRRIKLFRPDRSEHSVTKVVGGSRYVLSFGWVLGRGARQNPSVVSRGADTDRTPEDRGHR